MTDGGEFPVRHAGATDRSGTVGGIDQALVAKSRQLFQAVIENAGDFAFAIGIEVGPADIADEQGIPCEYADRPVLESLVIENVGQAVVGMAGRFQHLEESAADLERVAFSCLSCILDRLLRVRPMPDLRAGLLLQDRGA